MTTAEAVRHLYLARHGEALPDQSGLSGNGRRQAVLLGERLRDAPLSAVHHSPLPRAAQTAALIAEQLDGGIPLHASEIAGDYLPHTPEPAELPPDSAEYVRAFLARFPPEEFPHRPDLARQALERFTGPVDGAEERHELLVTHNFLIGWIVRAALEGPRWRWIGLNQGNAALTVIRYAPGRPPAVLVHNDVRHLPAELRWTGFPPEYHV
jgi:broad specificity phosphatase PhoE